MPSGYYLCGCKMGPRKGYPRRFVGGYINNEGNQVGGVEVCPEHESLPYGYRSPIMHTLSGQQKIDYSKMATAKLGPISAEVLARPDRRPKEMPDEEVQAWLRQIRAGRNGH